MENIAKNNYADEPRFRGIWYANQKQQDAYAWKYSGGLATYPQQIIPLAVYSSDVNRTYFTYAGSDSVNHIQNTVAYLDHNTGCFSNPHVVLCRHTNDAHYNGTLALSPDGHILLFCNSHGIGGEMTRDDPTYGKAYIYRSVRPHDISSFECIRTDNFSYSQVWPVQGKGLIWLHTRYLEGNAGRPLYCSRSEDGVNWSEPAPIVHMAQGSYQVSWPCGDRIVTLFDYHPMKGGLNARTNLYALETRDLGRTWHNLSGESPDLPLVEPKNPALERDWESEGMLVYLKDMAFDHAGNVYVLLLTSHNCWSGPEGNPRMLQVGRRENGRWIWSPVCEVDHNYDHGCLWIHDDNTWEVIAPIGPGAHPGTTGGDIQCWRSCDQGNSWQKVRDLTSDATTQHTYVRKPLDAHPDFWAFWANGDSIQKSVSNLFIASKSGRVRQLV